MNLSLMLHVSTQQPSPSTEVIITNSESEAKVKVGEMKNKMVVESSQNYVAGVTIRHH